MSGFEIVGVVFAVLPLFTQAGKLYAQNPLHKAVSSAPRDEKLSDFYMYFWWEIYELEAHLNTIIDTLPGLSEDRKRQIKKNKDLDELNKESDVLQAMLDFFPEREYVAFQAVMAKVLKLLAQLIKDDTLHISKVERDESKMYEKLRKFQGEQDAGTSSSRLWERIKFWRREKDRETCLVNLKTWNKRLGMVVSGACREVEKRKTVSASNLGPSSMLRTLSHRLFTALSRCWACSCGTKHEARFSLGSCQSSCNNLAQAGVAFDFLISHSKGETTQIWKEGTVVIQAVSPENAQNRLKLEKICEVSRLSAGTDHRLSLLVESEDPDALRIWRLSWQQPLLAYSERNPAVCFETLLANHGAPPLISRRRLALVFARSLLQLYENPWLSERWDKQRLYFFFHASGELDIRRPYLSTPFNLLPSGPEPPDLDRFHRNPGILKLGILLIETHTWRPLESFYEQEDLAGSKPTPNTELQVAKRVLKSMDDCFGTYLSAIDACLSVPWVPSGSRVSLDDAETRSGLYTDVVKPLESEVSLGEYTFKKPAQ